MATVIKENEDQKVVAEESFPPKAFPVQDGEGGSNQGPQNSSSDNDSDKWIIKFEQSVNIFLTVKQSLQTHLTAFSSFLHI